MTQYRQRFIQVVEHIEANLDHKPDVDSLCAIACLSRFHFHRLCSAFFGMSVLSLSRLLRLKKAAYQLAYRHELKVIDIALSAGYESHEAFSRAFRKHFALSPTAFRKAPDWSVWQQQYAAVLTLRSNIVQQDLQLEVEIVNFPETQIAVMEHKGPPETLGRSLQRFIQWRKSNALPPTKSLTFNLLYDDPAVVSPEDYRFGLCCSVPQPIAENNDSVVNMRIPAGQCARVRHIGSDDGLSVIIRALYAQWLPGSGCEVRDFPLFLQRVSFFPEVSEAEMITDIYLPLI